MALKENQYRKIIETLERAFPGRLLLKTSEAASVLGYSPQTFYNGTGPIKAIRIGKRPLYSIHDIAQYLTDL